MACKRTGVLCMACMHHASSAQSSGTGPPDHLASVTSRTQSHQTAQRGSLPSCLQRYAEERTCQKKVWPRHVSVMCIEASVWARNRSAFRLLGLGMGVWTLAAAGCGASWNFGSLMFFRAFVGVGEASFVALAAPFIGGCWQRTRGGRGLRRSGDERIATCGVCHSQTRACVSDRYQQRLWRFHV